MVIGPSTADLIEKGWLSKYKLYTPKPIDVSDLRMVAGDYDKKELDEKMKTADVTGDAVSHYQKYTPGQKALVFAWSVDSSQFVAERFNAAGIPAAHIDGTTKKDQREQIVRDFGSGVIRVLCNCEIVSEGYDCPSVQVLFLLRPTASLGLYLQQIGRGLRPSPGKEFVTIFDHANSCHKHGFPDDPRDWSLEGEKKKKRPEKAKLLCRTCPECHRTYPLSVRICECGFKLVLERELEVNEDAELAEVDTATVRRLRLQEQALATTLEELIALGRAKKYKYPAKWAAFVWEAREQKKAARERSQNNFRN